MAFVLHIGFDFWGAGNLGDDLMLAGFQRFIATHRIDCEISALCAHDLDAMRRRFPAIKWCPSTAEARAAALAGADAWLGLGGGVFQVEVGTWILEQMLEAVRAAKAWGLPAHLVGVGVNNAAAITADQSAEIHRLIDRMWLRDTLCVELALAGGFSPEKARLGADTAHLECAEPGRMPARPGTALVIHADAQSVSSEGIEAALSGEFGPCFWVCQEYRELQDAEARIYGQLTPSLQARMPLVRPDYATASLDELHRAVAGWQRVLSCRYHTCVAAAWSGARLAIYERNHKLEAVRADLGAERCHSLADGVEIRRALGQSQPVRRDLLAGCLSRANAMLRSYFSELGLLSASVAAKR